MNPGLAGYPQKQDLIITDAGPLNHTHVDAHRSIITAPQMKQSALGYPRLYTRPSVYHDGVNDLMTSQRPVWDISGLTELSICFWLYLPTHPAVYAERSICGSNLSGGSSFGVKYFTMTAYGTRILLRIGNGLAYSKPNSLPQNEWTFVCIVFNGNKSPNVDLYINMVRRVEYNTLPNIIPNINSFYRFGLTNAGYGWFYIHSFAMRFGLWSVSELKEFYLSRRATYSGAHVIYRFDEGYGDEVRNSGALTSFPSLIFSKGSAAPLWVP